MAAIPAYAASPRCSIGQISTANTALDGTGTIATVFTAGASGSRIDTINIKATGTTTAGMVRLFVHDGTNAHLLSEVIVNPITVGASVPSFESQLNQANSALLPLVLPTGYSLCASTHNAEAFNVAAIGGDF